MVIEDVWEIPLSTIDFDLVGHESLVEAHAHIALDEGITFVGEGGVGGQETKGHLQFNIQAVLDLRL